MKEVKRKNIYFLMLKCVLKCIESIRVKKWVKIFQNSESQLGGRGAGGQAKLVKSQLFEFFSSFNPSISDLTCEGWLSAMLTGHMIPFWNLWDQTVPCE